MLPGGVAHGIAEETQQLKCQEERCRSTTRALNLLEAKKA